jgi:hypothetical protein
MHTHDAGSVPLKLPGSWRSLRPGNSPCSRTRALPSAGWCLPRPPSLCRGVGGRAAGHLKHAMHVWSLAQELGFSMKLNTVVTRLNL